jgi:hypothetical protein
MEYRPNFQHKQFKGILSAENEKEILQASPPPQKKKNCGKFALVHTSHCDAAQEQAVTTHFLTVIYFHNIMTYVYLQDHHQVLAFIKMHSENYILTQQDFLLLYILYKLFMVI